MEDDVVTASPKISSGASDEAYSPKCMNITSSKGHGEDIIVLELFNLSSMFTSDWVFVGPGERLRSLPVACVFFGVDV